MNPNTATRRDPMNDVMPYEMLKAAHSLITRGQNEGYWASVPVPKRPIGQLRFEMAQQLATFAVPLAMVVWAYHAFYLLGLLGGVPLAWLTGYLLDRRLDRAIKAQARRDQKLDAGRYNAVKWLAEQMGLRLDEVTLAVVRKMDKDFVIVQSIVDQREAQIAANKKAAVAASVTRRTGGRKQTSVRGSAPRAAAVTHVAATSTAHGVAYAAAADVAYHDTPAVHVSVADAFVPDHSLQYNPASGLPMVEGTNMDYHGNMLGVPDQY